MQVELSDFRTSSQNVGKTIGWSKKLHVWEFTATFVNNNNDAEHQKYRIEFKDSVNSGKSSVTFNGRTLLCKSKIANFGLIPYVLQVKPIEISLFKDLKKNLVKTFDLNIAGMAFSHLKKAGGRIPLFLKNALPEQLPQPVTKEEAAVHHPPQVNTALQNDSKPQNEVSPVEVKPSSGSHDAEKDTTLDSFFDFGSSPQDRVEAKSVPQNNNIFSLDQEFDFSKNEPIKKQQTVINHADDFFDFAKFDAANPQRSLSATYPSPPVSADVFFGQNQFATNAAFMNYPQVPAQQFPTMNPLIQQQYMTRNMQPQFPGQLSQSQYATGFVPNVYPTRIESSDCLFTDKYKSYYIQQMAKQNVPPPNQYGFDHLQQYQTKVVQQNTKNNQLNQQLNNLIKLD